MGRVTVVTIVVVSHSPNMLRTTLPIHQVRQEKEVDVEGCVSDLPVFVVPFCPFFSCLGGCPPIGGMPTHGACRFWASCHHLESRRFLAIHSISMSVLITTVLGNQSCFTFQQRRCKKVNHSCIQKVVSFDSWPCRKRWRVIHKALDSGLWSKGMTKFRDSWSCKQT